MKNLGVVITDGVGFRNFILTDFIAHANQNFDKIIIFSCLPKFVYDDLRLNCEIIELPVFEETFATWFFRKYKEVAHLQLHKKNNFGITDTLKIANSNSKSIRGHATRFIFNISNILHSESWIQRGNAWQQATFKNHPITIDYKNLLVKNNIDLLFFTHQRPPFIAPLIYQAEQLKIKTATFIFSWDNLASKGRMAGNFDYYLVWSELMKTELQQFYPTIATDKIAIVGTPQFEPYVLSNFGYSKEVLASKFNVDIQKPTILFTCNDSSSKNDPIYLDLLANYIQTNQLVKQVNLVVRTSPAEEPERFRTIAEKYNFIVWNYPDWTVKRDNHPESWSQRVPSVKDISDLKALLSYSDLVINVLSTITLDAFIFDKPVINPVFGNPENHFWDDQKFLYYAHLKNLVKANASTIVKNENEFLNAINFILSKQDDKATQRQQFLDLQIGQPLQNTSKRIAETLYQWTK